MSFQPFLFPKFLQWQTAGFIELFLTDFHPFLQKLQQKCADWQHLRLIDVMRTQTL